MAKEDLDLVINLGDYICEYGRNEYVVIQEPTRLRAPGRWTARAAYHAPSIPKLPDQP